jgi:tetratricopeptide (TPR) repeat protein
MKKYLVKFSFFLILMASFSGCSYLPKIVFPQDPLTSEEHNNLGVAYESEGKYDLAISQYKKALDKDGNLITPLVNIGNVYFKQKRYKDAQKYYLKVLKKDEKNVEAANNLACLYIALGENYEIGIEYLSKAAPVESAPTYALDTLGVLHFRLGDKEIAMDILSKACEKAGDDKALLEEIEAHLKEMGEAGCANKPIAEPSSKLRYINRRDRV